jgi:hypothetical protein
MPEPPWKIDTIIELKGIGIKLTPHYEFKSSDVGNSRTKEHQGYQEILNVVNKPPKSSFLDTLLSFDILAL